MEDVVADAAAVATKPKGATKSKSRKDGHPHGKTEPTASTTPAGLPATDGWELKDALLFGGEGHMPNEHGASTWVEGILPLAQTARKQRAASSKAGPTGTVPRSE